MSNLAKQNLNYDLLIRPIITEKSTEELLENKYTFLVKKESNKSELKQIFEALFPGRKVTAVRTVTTKGYVRRLGKKLGRTSDGKKAIFTVVGEPIEIIAGVNP